MFRNRVGWARTYLKKAGLIESPRRGVFRITARGLEVLADDTVRVDARYLERFPEYIEFKRLSRPERPVEGTDAASKDDTTPGEAIESAHQGLRNQLADELLGRLLSCSPTFFEQVVVELLVKMGYGGSRRDAGERIGQSGDGGIDPKVVLIDGRQLASLMIDSDVGVAPAATHVIKRIDSDCFEQS